jgi:glutathione S-transferase
MLIDSGVEFEDERVPISVEWYTSMKDDPNVVGPLKTLPVLHWDSFMTPGTEAIALYLAHKLGYIADGSLESIIFSAALCASGHEDIITPASQFLYAAGSNLQKSVDDDFAHYFKQMRNRILPLEDVLGKKQYFLGDKLCAGDFFIYTACDRASQIFGDKLLDGCDQVKSFLVRMCKRPRLQEYLESRRKPSRFSGSGVEKEILQKTKHLIR